MSFSDIDRIFLQRCIDGSPRAWQDLVDRFLGLVIHVANHTAQARGFNLDDATRDDLVAEVFLTLLASDRGVLRRFRRDCSLATYLTVISRRVIARRLYDYAARNESSIARNEVADSSPLQRIDDRDQVERLMEQLSPQESKVVRMYHLEGKSYEEISKAIGMSQNSIGPLLSRARQVMREGA